MKWIRPWGKNWVPFQRRDLVRIKILKKNASSGEGEGYKQTGPVINESIGNGHVFDHPAASPDLSLIIFFHLEWAPAASSCTYNFAKIISVPHLPRIFIANTLTDRFHGPWKIPTTPRTYHFIEQNILDWNRKAGVTSRRTTARFQLLAENYAIVRNPLNFVIIEWKKYSQIPYQS